MAWTTPRTWTTGEMVTAALMNTHVRDNLNVVLPGGMTFILDGGGAAITEGSKLWVEMPFGACLQTATALGSEASTAEFGIVKNTFSNWGSAASSLYGSSPLKLASAKTAQITTLTTWSVSLATGDWIGVCATQAASGITWAAVALRFTRT